MGKPQRKKRTHKSIKDFKKKFRTRKRTKDIDEVHEDVEKKSDALLHQKVDSDLPGQGQFYCLFCARYFMDEKTLTSHKKTKNHKKRMRELKDKPYSQAEAEMAAGMGSFTIQVTKQGKSLNNNVSKVKNASSAMDTFSPASSVTSTSNIMEGLNIG